MSLFDAFTSAFSRATTPGLPLTGLSEDEQQLIQTLQAKAKRDRPIMQLHEAYYLGDYVVDNLRIAIPQELEFIRNILGWPSLAVNPYVSRLSVDCFRVPTATDGDERIMEMLTLNGFEAEQSLAFTDALSMSRAYWTVGSPVESGGVPRVTVDSPLNMTVLYDLMREPTAAMSEYVDGDTARAALILPRQTVHLMKDKANRWVVVDRDMHDFDFVPVVRMAHGARSNNRDGRSAITPALMSLTDSACRTLLGLEVARELYSVPQKALLGATEADFQNSDGSPRSAWQTYVTRVLALERDDEGNLPELKQLQPYDPSTFTKLLDWYASAASGEVAATPQELGLYTQGNPPSAEAVSAMNAERDLRARNMQKQFGPELVKVAQMMLRFENGGRLPAEFRTLAADWNPVALPTPAVTADAVSKEVAAGAVPATSDVVLKRLGYSQVERMRLEQDRVADDARNLTRALTQSLSPRQEATNGDVAADGIQ